MSDNTRKIETITTSDKLPYVDANGIIWHVDDLVAAWLCDRLKTNMPEVAYVAFGIAKEGTPEGIVRDLTQLFVVGGVMWYNHCRGEEGAEHDISVAVALDESVVFKRKSAVRALLEYPFSTLKVPRISITVNETNEPALKQAEKLGFKIEGIKRKAGSRGTDMVHLGLLPEECPFWTQA